ncbi:aminotransferase class V-fold PLP-dependent enzyme [Neptunitalea lumnitzerae]|uniref:Selenocysteine lyase n=1 Tax=Neptunitalea lumnitzerae TaxID=2965509 RepID=A0ABQ5ML73_9FLAO|nr:aminotransferase class V-fold PLP-dependent enzyme [Neptunitalea sp. Y10]GLB50161.1 selenocysteine lyase [Neptunitalea sp. Y10]
MITATEPRTTLEKYFQKFRQEIIGINQTFESPYGKQHVVYADWTASGRLYAPIEKKMQEVFGPYVANTHTETTFTGTAMTLAYHEAKKIIKKHVNSNENDILLLDGNGMTGVVNKFQRILGIKLPENLSKHTVVPEEMRPVVFVSHMEHHSNQTSWLETIAKVEVVPPGTDGRFCLENLKQLLATYEHKTIKIASITACSNVTGLDTPYHEVAKLMHQHGGVCFVDFACSAPYVAIDMHPEDEEAYLDAVFFSPHKFLGGPGTSGVLVFNKKLYKNMIPDCPGGGTVSWTNPWGEHKYISNIEDREDGGTPGFLQTIRTALAIQLKEEMGIENIIKREHEILEQMFSFLNTLPNVHVLAPEHTDRLGVISFYIDDLHYNLGVKLLNDKFGIQTRGGCSCAGTYGHYLLHVDKETSHMLVQEIALGDLIKKPGWIRLSIHPTLSCNEIKYMCDCIQQLAIHHKEWATDYDYDKSKNEFIHKAFRNDIKETVEDWFRF